MASEVAWFPCARIASFEVKPCLTAARCNTYLNATPASLQRHRFDFVSDVSKRLPYNLD